MQSGDAKTDAWVLDYAPEQPRGTDPLMGWTSSGDMNSQVSLRFPTREEAVAYARARGMPFRVVETPQRTRVKKSYADNFRFGRPESWTH